MTTSKLREYAKGFRKEADKATKENNYEKARFYQAAAARFEELAGLRNANPALK